MVEKGERKLLGLANPRHPAVHRSGRLSQTFRAANRDRVKINWRFTRKTARAKFGYKQNLLRRSETQV
jgi:hypothetical protein